MNGTVTRSPTAQPLTPSPTIAIVPANSWPGTCGNTMPGSWPCHPCQSLRHNPVAPTLTTTPPGAASGRGDLLHRGEHPEPLDDDRTHPAILADRTGRPARESQMCCQAGLPA